MKITVDITNTELDAIEDMAITWILCPKHNGIYTLDEIERYKMQQSCKECKKLVEKNSSRALHAWSKMVHAYNIARHGKCVH